MKLKEICTVEPVVIAAAATVQEAARTMRDHGIGMLPIFEDSRLVGIITDRDLVVRVVAEGKDPATTAVQDYMTREILVCHQEQDVTEAERIMEEKKVRRILVTGEDGRVVGIVSLGDLATRSDERCGVAHTLEVVSAEAA